MAGGVFECTAEWGGIAGAFQQLIAKADLKVTQRCGVGHERMRFVKNAGDENFLHLSILTRSCGGAKGYISAALRGS